MSIYIVKRETSNALYALVRSKHKRFQMLPIMYLGQQQDHAGSPAKSWPFLNGLRFQPMFHVEGDHPQQPLLD